jgi:squalene-associated FAD-dependent desaturase
VVVCGGGLAGIAAACESVLRGAQVTLVERRPFLGGKAYSFRDNDSGAEVDNGQHVYLGCCTAYIALLRLLGTFELTTLQPALDLAVRDREGRCGHLRASALPAPLHISPSFAAYPHLSAIEKAGATRVLLALMLLTPADLERMDGESFADWLQARDQGEAAISRFWDLIVLPTCNDRSHRVSAGLAAFVFREGLLRTRTGSAIGWSRVGLSRLIEPAARRFLEARGATVITGRAVTRIGERVVELTGGERLPADRVIVALPPGRVRETCPEAWPGAKDLGASPIVNVHVWYDRPVMEEPFVAVVDSPAQWVFNRTAMGQAAAAGHHLAVSMSGARDEVALGKDELAGRTRTELAHLFPAARRAGVERVAVVKEPEATFAQGPGQRARRPGAVTPVPGVFLAGAWTGTGWPATMEGAVRSGITAARHATAVG